MSLSSISIRRPVLATVLSLLIIIFGIVSLRLLGVREFPSVENPVISISTSYPGANAEIIESQITTPLEEEVNAVPGIRTLSSVSRDGRSFITVEFVVGTDLETAANDVRDKVSGAIGNLPPDAEPPRVSKADSDSFPILFLGIRSDKRDLLDLTALADRTFKARMQTIPGVSEVDIWGDKEYAMHLRLNPVRMAAYGISPLDVRDALRTANVELPSGRLDGSLVELTVRTFGRLATVEDFNALIVRSVGDVQVRLSDIGYAEVAPLNERTLLKFDGLPMVGIVLRPQPGANAIAITDEFYRRLEPIKRELPDDISTTIGFDTTEYIRRSIREVRETIFLAFALVVGIIFLFLREWRTTLIPLVVIPISLIGAFFVMYLLGFSINVLTLLGIVLAIGLVVDDAIVVLENIYAKIEQGMDPVEAGMLGTREIFLAVVATTAALVAVFVPIVFLGGLTGRLFREFGLVLAGAVIISSFVALSLTPMLCVKLLRRHETMPLFYRLTEPFFVWVNRGYEAAIRSFLTARWLSIPIILVSMGLTYWMFQALPKEMAPLEDRSALRVSATAPEGTSYEAMTAIMDDLADLVAREVPEIASMTSITAPGFGTGTVNTGFLRILLTPRPDRLRSQQEIADALTSRLRRVPTARISVVQDPTVGDRRQGPPLAFVIQAGTLEALESVVPEFLREAMDHPALAFADVNLRFNKPEIRVRIDRDRAQSLGVSVLDISQTMQAALSGQRFSYYLQDGKQYQVIGWVEQDFRGSPPDLSMLHVRSRTGEMITLDNLVQLEESSSPPTLFRFNRYASATVSATLAPGYTVDQGIRALREIGDKVLDDSFTTDLTGQARDFEESASSLLWIFLFALLLVYLVLSAQFESFRDPLVIMLTVPLALGGALVALWVYRETLNIFSQIGLIMLIGLVTKNGILLVEFANQRREAGRNRMEAAIEAAAARFRPILMTSLSTVLGILPIALALGEGSESRVSMGIAVIGGLLVGTALTLFVVPAVYTWISAAEITVRDADRVKLAEALIEHPSETAAAQS